MFESSSYAAVSPQSINGELGMVVTYRSTLGLPISWPNRRLLRPGYFPLLLLFTLPVWRYMFTSSGGKVKGPQFSLTPCYPMDCSLPDSSVHGIFQAVILQWVAIYFSKTVYCCDLNTPTYKFESSNLPQPLQSEPSEHQWWAWYGCDLLTGQV